MKSACFEAFGEPAEVIRLIECAEPPQPGPGEATLAMQLVPINPADLLNLRGFYGAAPQNLPATPGAEGLGKVTEVGPNVDHIAVGDLVVAPPGSGSWRQRLTVPATYLSRLPATADRRQLAMLRVNPATALAMLKDVIDLQPGDWVIQNAANSAVGHYLIQIAPLHGLRTVNLVRRATLIPELKQAGGDVVIPAGEDLAERVAEATGGTKPRLGIDAISGQACGDLASCLADGGTVVNYGALSGEPCQISTRDTIFRDIRLRGFWLRTWMAATPPEQVHRTYDNLAEAVAAGKMSAAVEQVYAFDEIAAAVAHAGREGRQGKILIQIAEE